MRIKKRKLESSQLLLIGAILVFIGIVFLSWNHLKLLREQVFENVRLQFVDDTNQTNPEIISSNVENINEQEQTPEVTPPKQYHYNYIGYLEIPRIGLKRGFVKKGSKYNNINYNVTISENADYPDVSKGNFILMAHSGDAYISYFAYLYRLQIGNIAKVTYEGKEYKYKLVKIEEQPKTGVVAIHRENYNKKALTLITCTKDNDSTQTIYIFEDI